MKENLRRLQLIFRLTRLKPEMFYCINIRHDQLVLQGDAYKLHKVCDELKFIDQNNCSEACRRFMRSNNNIIEIIKA